MLELLVEARGQAGLSQAQLAARLKKPASYVGKYELAERRLDIIEFVFVCNALGASCSDLLSEIEHIVGGRSTLG